MNLYPSCVSFFSAELIATEPGMLVNHYTPTQRVVVVVVGGGGSIGIRSSLGLVTSGHVGPSVTLLSGRDRPNRMPPNLVWWCIIMTRSVMQTIGVISSRSMSHGEVKSSGTIKLSRHNFWALNLSSWNLVHVCWCIIMTGVLCETFGSLSSRPRSQFGQHPKQIFWSCELINSVDASERKRKGRDRDTEREREGERERERESQKGRERERGGETEGGGSGEGKKQNLNECKSGCRLCMG